MNWRKAIYQLIDRARGIHTQRYLAEYARADATTLDDAPLVASLRKMLTHGATRVPYYQKLLPSGGELASRDPYDILSRLPILTKDLIRQNFADLKSRDLATRRWHENTSGGSTGEPIRLIQDREYAERVAAVALLYSALIGREIGQPEVVLWGSEKELFTGSRGWKTRLNNWLSNTTYLNAFAMTPERMRAYISELNQRRPRLILAYAQAIYELALFAEREQLPVAPQHAILTSAGTLYPFMREKLEQVFGCAGRVFNRYGSREVGLIACERPGYRGLVASPWTNYIEVVDDAGQPLSPGEEGEIVVTSLVNYAMPLLRYAIGDRGILGQPQNGRQILTRVLGRNVDAFVTADGGLIDGEYFTHLLYYRDWLWKFQVVQKTPRHLVYKLIPTERPCPPAELTEIREKSQLVLGIQTTVDFEFVKEIPPSPSGKYRYTISEVPRAANTPATVAATSAALETSSH
ncbi:MAG: AMP-binding protein [Pirellulales bacterium]|nr:AMP-binding protein [Pirellulales bacterium]